MDAKELRKRLTRAKYILCICEGAAEEDILNLLLDNDALIFSREQIIFDGITRERKASVITDRYLGAEFAEKIVVLRILDSKNENFKIKKPYNEKCEVININTNPEIEILFIIHKGKFNEYVRKYKSTTKPSEYCKRVLGVKGIKEQGFFKEYFTDDVKELINILLDYRKLSQRESFLFLADLLK